MGRMRRAVAQGELGLSARAVLSVQTSRDATREELVPTWT